MAESHGRFNMKHLFTFTRIISGMHTIFFRHRKKFRSITESGEELKSATAKVSRIGVRLVGGICYEMKNAPFDIFAEVAPIVDFAPGTDLSGNGGIGARFYFR